MLPKLSFQKIIELSTKELMMSNTFVMVSGELGDAYDLGFSDGYDGRGYNSPFPVGSNEDDEYEDGYSSGRLDFSKRLNDEE